MESREAQANMLMGGPSGGGYTIPQAAGRFQFNSLGVAPPQSPSSSSKPAPPPPPPPTLDSLGGLEGGSASFGDPNKKKRGRPRKYTPDGNIALRLAPTQPSPVPASSHAAVSSASASASDPPAKRNRGRPPGSGKKQLDALGGVGGSGFTPHVISVKTGEDIASKLMAFSQQGPRTVCILTANGAVCNVTLRQPAVTGGTVTYEGRFEIISLSGSFSLSENNGGRSRSGVLSVSLAGPDGRVLGGGVAGMLMAASPVQIILGSFIADAKKSNSSVLQPGASSVPIPNMLNFGAPVTSPSQGPSSESSDDNGSSPSPLNRTGIYNPGQQPLHNMQMYHQQLWASQTQQ